MVVPAANLSVSAIHFPLYGMFCIDNRSFESSQTSCLGCVDWVQPCIDIQKTASSRVIWLRPSSSPAPHEHGTVRDTSNIPLALPSICPPPGGMLQRLMSIKVRSQRLVKHAAGALSFSALITLEKRSRADIQHHEHCPNKMTQATLAVGDKRVDLRVGHDTTSLWPTGGTLSPP